MDPLLTIHKSCLMSVFTTSCVFFSNRFPQHDRALAPVYNASSSGQKRCPSSPTQTFLDMTDLYKPLARLNLFFFCASQVTWSLHGNKIPQICSGSVSVRFLSNNWELENICGRWCWSGARVLRLKEIENKFGQVVKKSFNIGFFVCFVSWKLRNVESRTNFPIPFTMFG